MRKTLLLGFVIFLVLALAFAPAGLLRLAIAQTGTAQLLQPQGTIWSGSGELLLAKRPVGSIGWQFRPVTLLDGAIGYHVTVTGATHELTGTVGLTLGRTRAEFAGHIASAFINQWLAAYSIELSGDFELQAVSAVVDGRRLVETGGTVTWSGGPVSYVLSGRSSSTDLPPLIGRLGVGPKATVFPRNGQTPLLQAELMDNGFAKIGVTKLLTKMLNNPWPGSDPDHAVVLEVEEQVF